MNGKIVDPIGLGVATSSGSNTSDSSSQGQASRVNGLDINKNSSSVPGVPNTGFLLNSQPIKYLATALGTIAIIVVAILWRKAANGVKYSK